MFSGSDGTSPRHVCTVRGTAAAATFHYISREFGESSLGLVAKELRPRYADVLDLDLLLAEDVDEWTVVPLPLVLDVMQSVGARYLAGAGGPETLAERVGAYAAYEAQPLLRRIVINLANPHTLIRRAAQLWGHYYSCGVLTAEETGERRVRLTVRDFHATHPLWCRRLTGYFREVLQRSSGRQARMRETRCAASGAPACEWQGDWTGSSLF
jgi:hypothetical protein